MKTTLQKTLTVLLLISLLAPASILLAQEKGQTNKKAIVLASFGTTYPQALVAILNIKNDVQKAFPMTKVKLAFTSNIIRNIWHKRDKEAKFWKDNPRVPRELGKIQGPLATIANLQDAGYRTIIVQPTHLYAGEEYNDVSSYVRGLQMIKTIKKKWMPFEKIVIGRPILGENGPRYPYWEDMKEAARALKDDIDLAKKKKAALVYMGHGNEHFCTGAYRDFEHVLRQTYPQVQVFICRVEGYPGFANAVERVTHSRIKKVVIKPLMIVAGDHAHNDMAGDEPDSLKSMLQAKAVKVIPVLHGLGENNDIAGIFVQHIKDVAKDNKITLQ